MVEVKPITVFGHDVTGWLFLGFVLVNFIVYAKGWITFQMCFVDTVMLVIASVMWLSNEGPWKRDEEE